MHFIGEKEFGKRLILQLPWEQYLQELDPHEIGLCERTVKEDLTMKAKLGGTHKCYLSAGGELRILDDGTIKTFECLRHCSIDHVTQMTLQTSTIKRPIF